MIFSTAVVALTSLAAVNAGVIRRHDFAVPSTYDAPALEPYQGYHTRYLALGCHLKHNTTFFDQCCHPLLKTETLEKARPAQCIPSPAAASSASAALPTTTIIPDGDGDDDGDDEDCEDGDDEPASSEAAPAPASSSEAAPAPASSSEAAALPSAPANVAPAPSPESSSAPAPPKATSSEVKPSPTPAPAPPAPKPSPASSSAQPESSPSSGGPFAKFFGSFSLLGNVVQNGIGTFFFQKGNPGNCGTVNPDSALIVALPTNAYASGAHCGKKVAVANLNNGKVQVATVADSCPTCVNDQSLDMSTGLYDALGATRDQGTFPIVYAFIN